MPRSKLRTDDSRPDPSLILEQHILAGFPPDLALDLVLNELVVRAAQGTRAAAAALALGRQDEMVCRAATGHLAPDLGSPVSTRDGLSGACLRTGQPQISVDTEFDPRIDPAVSRQLGIRSILIVPVFENSSLHFAGILEVFSPSPAAFSHRDQKLLEDFAAECSRICQAAAERTLRKPVPKLPPPELIPTVEFLPPDFVALGPSPAPRFSSDVLTAGLGSLAVLVVLAVSVLIAYRIGWVASPNVGSQTQIPQPPPTAALPVQACASGVGPGCAPEQNGKRGARVRASSAAPKKSAKAGPSATPSPAEGELVVYEKGKVIFRLKPGVDQSESTGLSAGESDPAPTDGDSIVPASSTTRLNPAQTVWLSAAEAQSRLLSHGDAVYPPEALAQRRSGQVTLELLVAEDGSVSSVRVLHGDPLLSKAATAAVRAWRYQPYRRLNRPSRFQTDVTVNFALPQ
jgi:TonB family protein